MRTVKTVLLLLGALCVGVLVYRVGSAPIVETLRRLEWWQFVLICLPYALISAVDTLGWRFAFARDRAPYLRLFGARLAGEALNLVTALGSVGGEAVKAWLLRRDVSYQESVPSVIIAKTTTTIAQALFLLIGVVLAWSVLHVDSDLLRMMMWLLVVEIVAAAGFLGVQVSGLVSRAGRLLRMFGVTSDARQAEGLDRRLRAYYRSEWRRFALSVGFHLLGWMLGALEAFVMLWALGIQASIVVATLIEALGAGVRFATFLVPASLGAFEGANAGVFAALGFGAGAGLAFSFVRRARQAVWVVVGMTVLVGMGWRRQRTAVAPGGRA